MVSRNKRLSLFEDTGKKMEPVLSDIGVLHLIKSLIIKKGGEKKLWLKVD